MEHICDICERNESNSGIILETEHWLVPLAADQGYLGRSFVVSKVHRESLSELTEAEWHEYITIVGRMEKAVKEAFGATLSNWGCLMNNAFQKTPSRPHVHWHFRPRYDKTVTINDVDFTDPMFAYHYDRAQTNVVDDETFNIILEKFKAHV
jgi:diadenosine tetraphosphate (Ap4A) HIT family hydrolase